MKRCTYLGCGGSVLLEQVEQVFQRASAEMETVCLSCGRSPDLSPKERECLALGCQRQDLREGLCPIHWRRKVAVA